MTTLITGANRGIGLALYERIPGAVGTSRKGESPYHTLDVTQPASITELAEKLNGTAIGQLICNAGVYLDKGLTLDDYTAQLATDTFAANITGVMLTVQAFLPHLKRAENPKIAIIASRMGSQQLAGGNSLIYRASKAAAVNIARNLAVTLKSDGIAVGAYHPGWVRTDMGGTAADVSVDDSAEGLINCFAELDMASTGCFRSFDGNEFAVLRLGVFQFACINEKPIFIIAPPAL